MTYSIACQSSGQRLLCLKLQVRKRNRILPFFRCKKAPLHVILGHRDPTWATSDSQPLAQAVTEVQANRTVSTTVHVLLGAYYLGVWQSLPSLLTAEGTGILYPHPPSSPPTIDLIIRPWLQYATPLRQIDENRILLRAVIACDCQQHRNVGIHIHTDDQMFSIHCGLLIARALVAFYCLICTRDMDVFPSPRK
jgi:hypothetical protein